MSAAMVSAGDMGVAAAPTAAAATEASMTSVSAAMSTSMAAAMSTSMPTPMAAPMAAATSAGGRKRWGKGDCSPEGCGGGDSDHGLSRHWGVILSGYPSTMRDVRSAI
jgi:hypothetical protein